MSSSPAATTSAPSPAILLSGVHCSHPTCRQLDFLPLTCSHCSQPFCSSHFRPSPTGRPAEDAHVCEGFDPSMEERVAPRCALCGVTVAARLGESRDAAMDRHFTERGACKGFKDLDAPAGPGVKKQKPKDVCSYARCNQRMIQPIVCPDCRLPHCPTHRHPKTHLCASAASSSPTPSRSASSSPAPSTSTSKPSLRSKLKPGRSAAQLNAGFATMKRALPTPSTSSSAPNSYVSKPPTAATTSSSSKSAASSSKPAPAQAKNHVPNPFSKTDRSVILSPSSIPPPTRAELSLRSRRAKEERESALRALKEREKRGLLSEQEMYKLAEARALEAKEKSGTGKGGGEEKDCRIQ